MGIIVEKRRTLKSAKSNLLPQVARIVTSQIANSTTDIKPECFLKETSRTAFHPSLKFKLRDFFALVMPAQAHFNTN